MTLFFKTPSNDNDYSAYVPGLWKYAQRLCGQTQCSQDLIHKTLDAAARKRWKKSENLPTEAWLSLLMVQEFYATPAHLRASRLH